MESLVKITKKYLKADLKDRICNGRDTSHLLSGNRKYIK